MKRRQFLRRAAGTATGLAVLSGTTAAATYDHQPEHVSLVYDKALLEQYRPLFVTRNLNITPASLRSWIAKSEEYDTLMFCYWAYYVAKEGVSEEDSHVPDREPFYVEVDKNSGDVVATHFDHYHYLRRTDHAPPTNDAGQLTYHIVKPWHPFQATTEEGVDIDVTNLHDRYQSWLDNDWKVYERAVVNPWTMKSRTHWWPEGTFGIETVDEFSALWYSINQRSPWLIPQPGRET